jgi:hypothetical protein
MNKFSESPDLKFKYVNGLGDFIAASLHSKPIGWFTKIVTGKNKPCEVCSMRRHALNILVQFPLWKFFFKNQNELLQNLAAEYRALGYKVELNLEDGKLDVSKAIFEKR